MSKTELRRRMIERRISLSLDECRLLSEQIVRRCLVMVDENSDLTIHTYVANLSRREVDTQTLIRVLTARQLLRLDLGVDSRDAPIPCEQYSMIIVPLVAFTKDLHRLGLGSGWYDRFLAMQPHAVKVGLAYDFQYVDELPVAPNDIPLDIVLTPSQIFKR